MSEPIGPVIRLAPAKLNLTLSVVGRRADGFHDLHSVMVPLALADVLSLAPAGAGPDTVHVAGPDTGPPADNLVLRGIAAGRAAVAAEHGRAVETPSLAARLEKRIPVAAGLAGGSSDGAAALDGSIEAWATTLPPDARLDAAARVGSDVAFFLAGGPALVEGRGERVTPLGHVRGAAPGVLLVTPAVASRTSAAFEAFDTGGDARPADPRSTRATSEHLAAELRNGLSAADLVARAGVLATANDLGPAAFQLVAGLLPLRRALSRLLGRPIGVSGSGPTLWALYPSIDQAREEGEFVERAIDRGELVAPGTAGPFVAATEFAAPHGPAKEDRE